MSEESPGLNRAEMLAAVIEHRERLKASPPAADRDELLGQLEGIECRLIDGETPTDDWEQFQLQWAARLADLRRSIQRRSAHVMLAFEDMERQDPSVFARDENAKKLLRWWRDEGGREQFMGSITLEERRELEAKARSWREKKP